MLLAVIATLSFASTPDAVLHGSVSEVYHCTDLDDQAAWTYVTLDVIDVLSGSLETPDGTFTVRLKYGYYQDGSRGGFGGLPQFLTGDEVVLPLHFDHDGSQHLFTIRRHDSTAFRVVHGDERANGILLDFDGRPILETSSGFQPLPEAIPTLVRTFPTDFTYYEDVPESNRFLSWIGDRSTESASTPRLSAEVYLSSSEDECSRRVRVLEGPERSFRMQCNLTNIGSVTLYGSIDIEERMFTLQAYETPSDEAQDSRSIPYEAVKQIEASVSRPSNFYGDSSLLTPTGQNLTVSVHVVPVQTYRIATIENVAEAAPGYYRATNTVQTGHTANAVADGCLVPTGPSAE